MMSIRNMTILGYSYLKKVIIMFNSFASYGSGHLFDE